MVNLVSAQLSETGEPKCCLLSDNTGWEHGRPKIVVLPLFVLFSVNSALKHEEVCVKPESDETSPGALKENQGLLTSSDSITTADPSTDSHAHLLSGTRHASIVDFILSTQCAISNSEKRTILAQFRAEYDKRLKSMEKRVLDVKQLLPQTPRQLKLKRNSLMKEARKVKSRISWNTGAMRKAIDKRNKQRREYNKINETISLVHELKKVIYG